MEPMSKKSIPEFFKMEWRKRRRNLVVMGDPRAGDRTQDLRNTKQQYCLSYAMAISFQILSISSSYDSAL
jgi:hypothetical protein